MDIAKLESRIEALEVQNLKLRRTLRFASVAGIAIALGAVVGWTQDSVQETIRAKRFQIVNDDDKVVGTFGIDVGDGGSLQLAGGDGFTVAKLGSDAGQNGGIQIFDRFQNTRLALARSSVGPNYLEIGSGNNMMGQFQPTVAIGDFGSNGAGFMVLPAGKSTARISATVDEAGNPEIQLNTDGDGLADSVWWSEKGMAKLSLFKKSADRKAIESSLTLSHNKVIAASQPGRVATWPPAPPKK